MAGDESGNEQLSRCAKLPIKPRSSRPDRLDAVILDDNVMIAAKDLPLTFGYQHPVGLDDDDLAATLGRRRARAGRARCW
jgi:hypothetical protein